jgi:hypothetical protein
MKKRTVELLDGRRMIVYLPETVEDVETLRDMDEDGDLDTRESLGDVLDVEVK